MSDTNLHKEIDLIQACITRMANNSFLLKGWTVSLVAVVLALTVKVAHPMLLCILLLIPLFSFWYLDSYFLSTERKYRNKYKWVLKNRPENSDYLYDLNPDVEEQQEASPDSAFWSNTLKVFYGVPVLITLAVALFWVFHDIIIKGICHV